MTALLPAFNSSTFFWLAPINIAHRVSLSMFCASDLGDTEARVTGLLIRGADLSHLRGLALASGTLCAAQVADWLCSGMPVEEQPSLLPSVAAAVQRLVREECESANTSGGLRLNHYCTCGAFFLCVLPKLCSSLYFFPVTSDMC